MSEFTGSSPNRDFDATWKSASHIPGWLTRAQAKDLWDAASGVPAGGTIVEIGSHQGRSTVVLASAPGVSHVVAIDPFVEGRLFGGAATRTSFEANIAGHHLDGVVDLRVAPSTALRPTWREDVDLLYIDGKHDYWTCSDDLRWTNHMPSGALVIVHDCYSSIGVTLSVLRHVLPARNVRYVSRTGSLATFEVGRPDAADRRRILAEIPWWLRNVVIKLLLRLRLRPVARLLGHDGVYDPY